MSTSAWLNKAASEAVCEAERLRPQCGCSNTRRGKGAECFMLALLAAVCVVASPITLATQTSAQPSLSGRSIAEQELWFAVQINGYVPSEPALLLRLSNNRLWVRASDLGKWHLQLSSAPPIIHGGEDFYALDTFPGLTYRLNEPLQTIYITIPSNLFLPTVQHGYMARSSPPSPSAPGTFFNYNVSSQIVSGETQTGGLFELGLFNSWGVGTAEFLARDYGSSSGVIRLDTTWTQDQPSDLASLRIGDAITATGSWGRSVRFGGVQWATNFATQPGFVPFPLPAFTGEAALPSTIDLFIDNALRMSRDVSSGPFTILDLPVVSGSGDATIVVRDMLGREQVVTRPYYTSPGLLQAGLNDFSYEAGFIRNNYGIDSNDYGRFAAAGTQRHGLTDSFTGEVHVEVLRNQQTAGVGGTFLLSSWGILNASVAASHSTLFGEGGLALVGFERQTERLSFGGNVQLATRHFTELGLTSGTLAPRLLSQAFASFSTTDHGSFGLSYAAQKYRDKDSIRLASASYNINIGKLGYMNISAIRYLGRNSDTTVSMTFTRPIGENTSASATLIRQKNSNQALADVQRNLPAGDGFGYHVQAGTGDSSHLDAAVSYQNRAGTYSLEAFQSQSQTSLRGEVLGGAVLFGGDLFLNRRVDESFSVVQVPQFPNVRVYADNQLVATTNAAGNALVPHLRAYEDNPIRVEQADLPIDTEIDTLQLTAVPGFRSGALVTFPIRPSSGGSVIIVLDDAEPLPAGAIVQIIGQPQTFPVGMRGDTYVTGLAKNNQLRVTWRNKSCEFSVPYTRTSDPLPQLGTYVCAGVQR